MFGVLLLFDDFVGRKLDFLPDSVGKRAFFTRAEAVEANDATRVVDRLVLRVDAGALATLFAKSATYALARVNARFEERKLGQEPEERTDGADGVAVEASVTARDLGETDKRDDSDDKRPDAFDGQVDVEKRVFEVVVGGVLEH